MKSQSTRRFTLHVYPNESEFTFGSCALNAIGQGYNIGIKELTLIALVLKIKEPHKGLSFTDCKKLINFVSLNHRWRKSEYVSNKANLLYNQLAYISLTEGSDYLVMFDEHLSYLEKGIIYDTFICVDAPGYTKIKPTGWWKIK